MTTKAHKNLTGVDLHEPKGVAAATSGQTYVADGAGSGVWTTLVLPTGTFFITMSEFTASGTWTKPANLFLAEVSVWAEGGPESGGAQSAGNASSFGSHISCNGGQRGISGGAGGTATGGTFNYTGQAGNAGSPYTGGKPLLIGGRINRGGAALGVLSGEGATGAASQGGGGGGSAIKYITAASLASTVAVTIGAAASYQNNGYVLVKEYISVV